ncbi:helix-turn-helix domain-containing protein [Butyricicoccus sp. 1XD8-22]|nr:helix-turn-helix domain-containing protein [Butyricicoccus sp. 1XD8-22]
MSVFHSIHNSGLGHRAVVVYRCLQDHANAEGCCWLAINTIAAELHLSRATVKRALDELYREGFIRREYRWRENGSLSSNLYHVL